MGLLSLTVVRMQTHPNVGARQSSPKLSRSKPSQEAFGKPVRGSIPTIIRAYKASVTYRLQREFSTTAIWQRNYYEHIIRNEAEYNRIHAYIEANPTRWGMDKE